MIKKGRFVAKISKMGDKQIVLIPSEFHKQNEKVMGKSLIFEWEEVMESEDD